MDQQLEEVRRTVETMVTNIAGATSMTRAFAGQVAFIQEQRTAHPNRRARHYFDEAIAACQAVVPVLKELQRTCEQLIQTIEGRWTPPTN